MPQTVSPRYRPSLHGVRQRAFPRFDGTTTTVRLPRTRLSASLIQVSPAAAPPQSHVACLSKGQRPKVATLRCGGSAWASQVPGQPLVWRAVFHDSGRGSTGSPYRPQPESLRALNTVSASTTIKVFGADSYGPPTRCLRFVTTVTRSLYLTATQDSLQPARGYGLADGNFPHWVGNGDFRFGVTLTSHRPRLRLARIQVFSRSIGYNGFRRKRQALTSVTARHNKQR